MFMAKVNTSWTWQPSCEKYEQADCFSLAENLQQCKNGILIENAMWIVIDLSYNQLWLYSPLVYVH